MTANRRYARLTIKRRYSAWAYRSKILSVPRYLCADLLAVCLIGGMEPGGYVRVVEVIIRTYKRRDAAGVANVFYRSVRDVALSDYTSEQVRACVPGRWDAEREHHRSGDGRLVLVAEDESGHVVAFIDLEPDGHIDRLFCAPEVAGRGVASRLYDVIETVARAQGIQRLSQRLASWPGASSSGRASRC